MGLVNRLLPDSNGRHDGVAGREALAGQSFVRNLVENAAESYNQ